MSGKQSRSQRKEQDDIPPTLSPSGQYIATVNGRQLNINPTSKDQILSRSISLHDHVSGQIRFLQWSKSQPASGSSVAKHDRGANGPQRILCASGNHISLWDANDETWSAEIEAGDGLAFAHVDFTASPDEVIAISEFSTQLMLFSVKNGEQRVIKSPKYPGSKTYAIRPKSGHLAVLLKLDSGDVLSLHELTTYEAITAANIPTTNAQGLKWSPNGKWLATWDSASVGTKVVIYTADGQHFRTYEGSNNETDFGAAVIEWSPDSRFLAIGKYDGTVELINGATFTLTTVLGDPISTKPIGRDVYIEHCSGSGNGREYALAPESPVFPYTYNVPSGNRVVSMISFSPTGTMIATVDKGLPHIVWMWSIGERGPRLIGAMVQKSKVKQLLWNTELRELLMTIGDDDEPTVHQWICGRVPRMAAIPATSGPRYTVSWINAEKDRSSLFWFGWQTGYVIGYVIGTGSLTQFHKLSSLDEQYPSFSKDDFPLT